MRAVITVIGQDKPGIIASISALLLRYGANILDISQTIMQELFTMIMIIDLRQASFDELYNALEALSSQIGLSIRLQHADIFEAMHRV